VTIQVNRIVYAAPDKGEERWIGPDLLRVNDELVLLHDAPNAAAVAEDHLHTATSPDWFWQRQRRTSEARRAPPARPDRLRDMTAQGRVHGRRDALLRQREAGGRDLERLTRGARLVDHGPLCDTTQKGIYVDYQLEGAS
jgi:hypothetical protein